MDLKPTTPENWHLRPSGVYKRIDPTTNGSDVVALSSAFIIRLLFTCKEPL